MLAERAGLRIRSIQGLERGETQPRRDLAASGPGAQLSAEEIKELETAATRCRDTGTHLQTTICWFNSRRLLVRERELAEFTDRRRSTRLLTLTGTGGCGKPDSRLNWPPAVWTNIPTVCDWWNLLVCPIRSWWRSPSHRRLVCGNPLGNPFMSPHDRAGMF